VVDQHRTPRASLLLPVPSRTASNAITGRRSPLTRWQRSREAWSRFCVSSTS